MSRYSSALHMHKNYKLIYCTNGGGRIQFEKGAYPYQKGDLVVIEPDTMHMNVTHPDFAGVYLTIDQMPFKIDKILIVPDTESGAIAQCVQQVDYFYQQASFDSIGLIHSYCGVLYNLIASIISFKRISPVIESMKKAIYQNFSDPQFEINDLVEAQSEYNPNYLKKRFKKELGTSPQQFLINVRLNYAAKLLVETVPGNKISVSSIAYACGYEDPLYFSRAFKIHYGASPKAFYKDSHC